MLAINLNTLNWTEQVGECHTAKVKLLDDNRCFIPALMLP